MNVRTNIFVAAVLVLTVAATVATVIGRYTDKQQASTVTQQMDRMWQEAKTTSPSITQSEALAQQAQKRMSDANGKPLSRYQRRSLAAQSFLVFFVTNTRGRADYCKDLGVDISHFVQVFENEHKSQLAQSRSLLSTNAGYSSDHRQVAENKLYSELKVTITELIKVDMQDSASAARTSTKAICGQLVSDAASIVHDLHFEVAQPELNRLLVNAEP